MMMSQVCIYFNIFFQKTSPFLCDINLVRSQGDRSSAYHIIIKLIEYNINQEIQKEVFIVK